MLELCTPIIYGSPKVATYHRKAMDIPTNFAIIASSEEALDDRVNILNCVDDELKVELSKPTREGGKAALDALAERVIYAVWFEGTALKHTQESLQLTGTEDAKIMGYQFS